MSQETRRAIASVTDKRGLAQFKALFEIGWEFISTGGTARTLREHGIECRDVAEVTGMPECLDGRVKTLHPAILGGILADRSKERHREDMAKQGFVPIDMVVVNTYRFEDNPGRESIDIGGPTMLRAAVKNLPHVIPVVDPDDYEVVIPNIVNRGGINSLLREKLAIKVMSVTHQFDQNVSEWMREQIRLGTSCV